MFGGEINYYHEKYKSYPAAADDHLFDAVMQVANAVTAGKTNKTDILEYLKQDFKGVAGQYTYLGDGSFSLVLVKKTYRDGKFVKTE